jgi:uncharacterized membrane protein HdeD (DUF308 family)
MVLFFGFFALIDAGLTIITALGREGDKGEWTLLLEGGFGLVVCVIVLVGSTLGSMIWPPIAAIPCLTIMRR